MIIAVRAATLCIYLSLSLLPLAKKGVGHADTTLHIFNKFGLPASHHNLSFLHKGLRLMSLKPPVHRQDRKAVPRYREVVSFAQAANFTTSACPVGNHATTAKQATYGSTVACMIMFICVFVHFVHFSCGAWLLMCMRVSA